MFTDITPVTKDNTAEDMSEKIKFGRSLPYSGVSTSQILYRPSEH
jgi:hypothetical protein